MKLTKRKLALAVVIVGSVLALNTSDVNAVEMAPQQKHKPEKYRSPEEKCLGMSDGAYFGTGAANDLRGDAAFNYRGHLWLGYKFCSGVKIEFRHTSVLGDDDGIDLDGDLENDIATSENSVGLYYEAFFEDLF